MSSMRTSVFAVIALAALVPATAAAQSSTRSSSPMPYSTYPWNIGVLGGVTVSNVSTDDDVTLTKVVGAQAGVFADRSFGPNVGGRVEALISQRGARNDAADNNMRLAYLDIPVLVRVGSTVTNRTHVHAFTGLTPGIRLKTSTTNGSGLSTDITTDVKTFDLGWVIGAAVEQGAWSLDGRYTLGLVNQNNAPTGAEFKNRSFSVNVGYRIR